MTFSISLDKKAEQTLEELQRKLNASSKAEVLRTAVALLKVVVEGRSAGLKVCLVDAHDKVMKELLMPRLTYE